MSRSELRDIIISAVMIISVLIVLLNPARKFAAGDKINLNNVVPETFCGWQSHTYDTSSYSDKWQSINELLMRIYAKKEGVLLRKSTQITFTLEYSSDLRKNFSLHFPEGCYRAGGNEIEFFKPLEIKLGPGKVIKGKCLYIKGRANSSEESDKLVIYWLVIDNTQYYETLWVKFDQMLSGLLKKSKKGFLVRFDYSDIKYSQTDILRAKEKILGFVTDLYGSLDENSRLMVFGG